MAFAFAALLGLGLAERVISLDRRAHALSAAVRVVDGGDVGSHSTGIEIRVHVARQSRRRVPRAEGF